jgi:hypothetical protein
MLAQSGEADDREHIARSFRLAERFRISKNLAAWATAAIELEGADAILFIERRYLNQPGRTREELVEIVKALALHGNEGRTEFRERIDALFRALLDIHPEMSDYVAKDLAAWNRFRDRADLSPITNPAPSESASGSNANRQPP